MRRGLGVVVFILGSALLLLAPFLRFYTAPRVEKAPVDVYDITVSEGTGSYFSTDTFDLTENRRIRNTQIAKGDPEKSTEDVAVISFFNRTEDLDGGRDIEYSLDIYTFDRRTGFAVHCCGEKPRHDGVTLKFPFDSEKKTYPLWDSTGVGAYPARFMRREVTDGLDTYRYRQRISRTQIGTIDLPGLAVGQPDEEVVTADRFYASNVDVWIDPVTGQVIKGHQNSSQWVEDESGAITAVLADLDLTYTPKTVQGNVDEAGSNIDQLRIVKFWGPLIGIVVGIPLALLGLALILRSPGRPEPAMKAHSPAEATA